MIQVPPDLSAARVPSRRAGHRRSGPARCPGRRQRGHGGAVVLAAELLQRDRGLPQGPPVAVIGKVHAMASWDARAGRVEIPASSGCQALAGASAAVSSPVSTAIIAAVQPTRRARSSVPLQGWTARPGPGLAQVSRDQNSHKTRNRCVSGRSWARPARGGQVARLGLQPQPPPRCAAHGRRPARPAPVVARRRRPGRRRAGRQPRPQTRGRSLASASGARPQHP